MADEIKPLTYRQLYDILRNHINVNGADDVVKILDVETQMYSQLFARNMFGNNVVYNPADEDYFFFYQEIRLPIPGAG